MKDEIENKARDTSLDDTRVRLEDHHWESIDKILLDALGQPAEERKAFLDRACREDPTLRARIEDLLARDAALGSIQERVAAPIGLAEVLRRDPGCDLSIGSYRITDVLGEGGMGIVYRGEQTEPVERAVAIKVIKKGIDSEDMLARFEGERQALALMSHPNVATVFDTGRTEDGRPYLAMEYVPGEDLVTHCDRENLTLEARIRLFLDVCDGVQHAHQKGIIHRDLKPANILVRVMPGDPSTPKIIDFGIAKSLQRKLNPRAAHTQVGVFLGTLLYSSPEQMTGRYSAVDTRSDIYALGAILYEILAGAAPRTEKLFQEQSQHDLHEILDEQQTPRPSDRFDSLKEDREAIAARRGLSTDQLRRTLSGDLSWILIKCLEKDPNDRYPSVQDLRNDLERWLGGRPVEARRSTGLYRVGKFVRRHRRGVALAMVGAVALLGATTAAIVGFVRAERASQDLRTSIEEARRSEDRARRAAEEAKLAAEFQATVLRSFKPSRLGAGTRSELVNAVRSNLSGQIDAQRVDQQVRQLEAWLEEVNFTDIALSQLAHNVFRPAEDVIADQYGEHPLLQAALWQSLAETTHKVGLLETAAQAQDQALARREELLSEDHELTLASLESRAKLRRALNDNEGAVADARRLLAAREKLSAPLAITEARRILGGALVANGQTTEGLDHLQEALRRRIELQGTEHADVLTIRRGIAYLQCQMGYFAEAEAQLRQALRQLHESGKKDDNITLDLTLQLASVLAYRGNGEAERLARYAAAATTKEYGEDHFRTENKKYWLAIVLHELGQLEEAEAILRTLIERGSPTVLAYRYGRLGRILLLRGQTDQAEIYLRKALALSRQHSKTNAEFIVSLTSIDLAEVHRRQKNYREALATARRALDMMGTVPMSRLSTPRARLAIGRTLTALGRFGEAEAKLSEAWRDLTRIPGGEWPRIMDYTARAFIELYASWRDAEPGRETTTDVRKWRDRLAQIERLPQSRKTSAD